MSNRDPIETYSTGDILAKESELRAAKERLKELVSLVEALDKTRHPNEYAIRMRKYKRQLSTIENIRDELAHMRRRMRDA